MAALASPTWAEVLEMEELVLVAINIVKGQANGDEFIWEHVETDEDGVVRMGIWKSTLDERKKKNSGRVT